MNKKLKIRCKECKRENQLTYSEFQMTYIFKCECGRIISVQASWIKSSVTTGKSTEAKPEPKVDTGSTNKTLTFPLNVRNRSRDSLHRIKTNQVIRRLPPKKKSFSELFNYKPGWQKPVIASAKPVKKMFVGKATSAKYQTRSTDYEDIHDDTIKDRTCPVCGRKYKGGPVCPGRALHFKRHKPANPRLDLPKDAAVREFLKESHRYHVPMDRDD